jgi:SAM-dependent methyltransferase
MTIDYKGIYDDLFVQGFRAQPSTKLSYARLAPHVLERIPFKTALDVGSGVGHGVELLNKQGKEVTGVEVSPFAAATARAYGRNVVEGSALSLPFPDASFDLVLSSDVMEHLHPDDVEQAIKEQVRVSRKYLAHRINDALATSHWNDLVGFNMHLTVKPIEWWIQQYQKAGVHLLFQDEADPLIVAFKKPCLDCRRKKGRSLEPVK